MADNTLGIFDNVLFDKKQIDQAYFSLTDQSGRVWPHPSGTIAAYFSGKASGMA